MRGKLKNSFSKKSGGKTARLSPDALLVAVANSYMQYAAEFARDSRRLGIDLDRQDRFKWNSPAPSDGVEFMGGSRSEWHEWMGIKGRLDIEDRFHWIRGEYLRNTALLLAVKKGWDHQDDQSASRRKMGPVIKALLKNGANPDIQDACGNTALHIAVLHRDIRSVALLLRYGARTDIRNNAGSLPQDLLNVRYEDINPFLYQQCGNDTNCYIHTLQDKASWRASGNAVAALLQGAAPRREHEHSGPKPAP